MRRLLSWTQAEIVSETYDPTLLKDVVVLDHIIT